MKQLHKKMDIDLLIFDLDGTLIDSRQDITNSVNYTREKFNLSELSLRQVMDFVGDGAQKLLERSLTDTTQAKIVIALDIFKKHYQEHMIDNTVLYPGVNETLTHFSTKKKVIISNKPAAFTQQIVDRLFPGKFNMVFGGDSLRTQKPSPEPILKAVEEMSVPLTKTAIIGDGSPDIVSGKAAGITTCAVTYGFRSKDYLMQYEPDYCIDSFPKLREVFV